MNTDSEATLQRYARLAIVMIALGLSINIILVFFFWRASRSEDEPEAALVQTPTVPTYSSEMVSAGEKLFMATCASCHGNNSGVMTGNLIGKNLVGNPFVQAKSDGQLLNFIIEGRMITDPANTTGNAMPARGGNPLLTDDELYTIVAYLRTINGIESVEPVSPPLPDVVVGTGAAQGYQWVKVVDNLDSPLGLVNADDGTGRLFVLEQTGFVWVIKAGAILPAPFLDVSTLVPDEVYSGGYTEQGLLGVAFHPQFEQNGRLFVSYTDRNGDSLIARLQVMANDPNRADPSTAVTILTLDQPFADHNGGDLVFGHDGYLYIGFGDGGRPSEPNYFSQNPQTFLGKLLRIDVNAEDYSVPEDNPFVDNRAFLPEIWALGLRNPWRFSFDRQTGDLYIADVGQWQWEEINFQPAASPGGQNYGWSAYEATHPYLADAEVSAGELTMPVLEYSHEEGCSITGGFVYRGGAIPTLQGRYFYGDYCNGNIWTAWRDGGGKWQSELFLDTDFVISSFGEDETGELYLVHYKGSLYRLEAAP